MIKLGRIFQFFKKYLPVFLLVNFSGNPIITHKDYSNALLIGYTIVFLVYILFIIDVQTLRKVMGIITGVIGLIVTIVLFQQKILGFVSYPGILGYILRILLTLSTLLHLKHEKVDFLDAYIKTLAFVVVISFPFWILNQFGFYGFDAGSSVRRSLIFYTSFENQFNLRLTGNPLVRNSGVFWEPGAFAGYLILAIVFIAFKNRKFQVGPYKKEFILLLVGLLTTQSTTGYITFMLILVIHSMQTYNLGKIVIIPLMIFVISLSYLNLNFLREKIDRELANTEQMSNNDISSGRFGAIKMDLQYIKSQPIIGNGWHVSTRYRFHPQVKDINIGHGNGMSNIIVIWGIPFFMFWLICVYRFARQVSQTTFTALSGVFIIVLLLQGEQFLYYPVFLSFFFLPFVYENIMSFESKLHIIKSYFYSK